MAFYVESDYEELILSRPCAIYEIIVHEMESDKEHSVK